MVNELSAWALAEIEKGDFEKAYRISKVACREKLHTRDTAFSRWEAYGKALLDLTAAESIFEEAMTEKNVDAAIEKLGKALKQVELCRRAIKKGASEQAPIHGKL